MRCLSHEASKGIGHCNGSGMTVGVWLSMRDPERQQQHDDTCAAQTQSGFEGETAYQPVHDGAGAGPERGRRNAAWLVSRQRVGRQVQA